MMILNFLSCQHLNRTHSSNIHYDLQIKQIRSKRKQTQKNISIDMKWMCMTHQKRIRSVLATSSVRHTNSENPSASCVCLICRYCGTYGTTPPITIADAAAPPIICDTRKLSSSLIIQSSIVDACCLTMITRDFFFVCLLWQFGSHPNLS